MRRPCFALAMLLGSLATSMFLVGTVNSQSPAGFVILVPGPAELCGHLLASAPVDKARPRVAGVYGPEAADPVVEQWTSVQGTGYDEAYDFAMFQGEYVKKAAPERAVAASDPSSSATEITAPPRLPAELAQWFLSQWRRTHRAVRGAAWQWWISAHDSQWGLTLRQEWAARVAELRYEELLRWEGLSWGAFPWENLSWDGFQGIAFFGDRLGDGPAMVAENTVESSPQPVGAEASPTDTAVAGYDEEVLLISAADSLDRLGQNLQLAAQHLRIWAAERIVAKGDAQRVARVPEKNDERSVPVQ